MEGILFVSTTRDDLQAMVEVTDSGIGMESEQTSRFLIPSLPDSRRARGSDLGYP